MKHPSLLNKLGFAWQAGAGQGQGISRRGFIKLAGASGLALGLAPVGAVRAAASGGGDGAELKPNQQPDEFLRIDPDGTVTIRINRLEFGQGSHTGLARVLADELDADWLKVRAELAPAGEAYKDPIFGIQMTGGSNSIQNSFTQYRELGARRARCWSRPPPDTGAWRPIPSRPGKAACCPRTEGARTTER